MTPPSSKSVKTASDFKMTPPSSKSVKTARYVLDAIYEMHDDGASKREIQDYIENEFSVPNKDVSKYLSKALQCGVQFGAIKKLRDRYYVGPAVDGVREHRRRRKSRKGGKRRRRRSRKRE